MSNIVFIVEKVPRDPRDCPFSTWYPYPPVVQSPGYYECSFGGKCQIENGACSHMKEHIGVN